MNAVTINNGQEPRTVRFADMASGEIGCIVNSDSSDGTIVMKMGKEHLVRLSDGSFWSKDLNYNFINEIKIKLLSKDQSITIFPR